MTLLQITKLALMLSIVLSVLALAMRARPKDVFYLVREWRMGLAAALAMYVVVPAAAIVMCLVLPLLPAVKIALIAIAFSPMPPILPGKQLKVGARPSYVEGLIVLTTALSVIVAPVGVALAAGIFGVEAAVPPAKVATVVGLTVALPLVLGLAAGRLRDEWRNPLAKMLGTIGKVLLAASALVLIVALAPAMWEVIGDGTLMALLAIIVVGLGAGFIFGGPSKADKAALSLASATRHPGVAVAIATLNFPDEKLAPAAVVLALLLATVLGLPMLKVMSSFDDDEEAALS